MVALEILGSYTAIYIGILIKDVIDPTNYALTVDVMSKI